MQPLNPLGLLFANKMGRVAISKGVRFEVFKRDSFTCQYCGSKSPEVVLHVDHINPVSKGGTNDIMNLVTSCISCNLGKSAKLLSDSSTLEKQRLQLDQLNERREQLEMMIQWRDGLTEIDNIQFSAAHDRFDAMFSNWHLSDIGKQSVNKLVRKHGLDKVLEVMPLAYEKAMRKNEGEETIDGTLSMIGVLISVESMDENEKKARYIRGILKNRFGNIPMEQTLSSIRKYSEDGFCLDDLMEKSKYQFRHYTHFTQFMDHNQMF